MTGDKVHEQALDFEAELAQQMQAAKPNLVVTFVDPEGRTWLAAGWLGPLTRFGPGGIQEQRTADQVGTKEFRITEFNVVEPS